jgi:hypothetical protein
MPPPPLKLYVLAISPSQKWWETNVQIEILVSHWGNVTCTRETYGIFFWGQGEGDLFRFFLFPMCFQCVPNRFLSISQQVSQVFNVFFKMFPIASIYPKMSSKIFNQTAKPSNDCSNWHLMWLWKVCSQASKSCLSQASKSGSNSF